MKARDLLALLGIVAMFFGLGLIGWFTDTSWSIGCAMLFGGVLLILCSSIRLGRS